MRKKTTCKRKLRSAHKPATARVSIGTFALLY
jgi:hypothetical protein